MLDICTFSVKLRSRASRACVVESGSKRSTSRGYCRRHLYFNFFGVANTSTQLSTGSSKGHHAPCDNMQHAMDQRSGTARDLFLSPG